MKLDEILDKAVPFKVTEHAENHFQAEFFIDKLEYIFMAHKEIEDDLDDDEEKDVWEVDFSQLDKHGVGKTNVTKTGNEFEVFGTIKKIMEKFISEVEPKVISFTASKGDRSRGSLYAKLFTKNLPAGYELTTDNKSSTRYVNFELRKKDKQS